MKFKEKKKTILFPVFQNYKVIIIASTDKYSVYKRLRKKLPDLPHDPDFEAMHIFAGMTSYLLFPWKVSAGTVAHESWHVIKRICEWSGAAIDNEIIAYYLGYLTNTVYDFINS